MNEKYFYDRIRRAVFGGRLTAGQVEGVSKILAFRDQMWPGMSDDELAYVLATTVHETAHTMQPITERGSQKYLRSKPYWPWIGRGLVQITWERNYKLFRIDNPDDALKWPVALDVMFRGMVKGMFTGKKLADYIVPGRKPNYIGARRIINGTDRAKLVAGYAFSFQDAFKQANAGPNSAPAARART
jgi:putative chitinase